MRKRGVAHEALLKQIAEIEARAKSLRDIIAERKEQTQSHGTPEAEYTAVRETRINQFRLRGDLIVERCEQLTALSDGAIKATLRKGSGTTQVSAKLSEVLDKSGIRGQSTKVDALCGLISDAPDCIVEWETILKELEGLADIDFEASSSPSLPNTPKMNSAGFSRQDIEKVARKLRPETWLDLALAELEDTPIFEYKQREDEYIKFADASAGQQATALLRVLLHQPGPPLIIDQPEEDLDNQVILQIVEELWHAKSNRQIIFSSHNANIVVNGDADFVICCDYRTTGDQSGGKIKCQGAIDVEDIRKEITAIMEGGKEAFRMRKDKYGF